MIILFNPLQLADELANSSKDYLTRRIHTGWTFNVVVPVLKLVISTRTIEQGTYRTVPAAAGLESQPNS
eukprot:scaffold48969_cov19-Prasinocladus_malaysianus.AAC.2